MDYRTAPSSVNLFYVTPSTDGVPIGDCHAASAAIVVYYHSDINQHIADVLGPLFCKHSGKQRMSTNLNRPLTSAELKLAKWMLEHGSPAAQAFLSQLDIAEISPFKCPCGCASIHFQIRGREEAPPGVHILGDFMLVEGGHGGGAFIFENGGLLSGIEVYSDGDPVTVLPTAEDLRAF